MQKPGPGRKREAQGMGECGPSGPVRGLRAKRPRKRPEASFRLPGVGWVGQPGAVRNIVYFDLETQKSAEEVGGWDRIRDMRMSLGVTYSTARGGYRVYSESQVAELLRELQRADLVVGFNHLRFDYEVLQGYSPVDLTQNPNLDMMVDLRERLGHRLGLDSIAEATFGLNKTSEGLQALEWFKQGKMAEIAEYCCFDVKITKLVHEFGVRNRQLFYKNRFGAMLSVAVDWKP